MRIMPLADFNLLQIEIWSQYTFILGWLGGRDREFMFDVSPGYLRVGKLYFEVTL